LKDLNEKAFAGLFFLLLVMAALLFVPAWTLGYWQAWAFLAVFGASAFVITLYLMTKDPKLLVEMREECSTMTANYCFGTNSPSDSRAFGTTLVKWNVAL
jgi:hypothetical protein